MIPLLTKLQYRVNMKTKSVDLNLAAAMCVSCIRWLMMANFV